MRYRVGQKVRLLHAQGEGVITALIDKYHVEVDMGDDFPLDMHVDELVAVDQSESSYLGGGEEEPEVKSQQPQLRSASLLDLSLVVSKDEEENQEVFVANPEITDKLIAVYYKQGSQYIFLDAFQIDSGSYRRIASLDSETLSKIKSFYVQSLAYTPGKGHPHLPYTFELSWNKSRLMQAQKPVNFMEKKAWVFSLREDKQKLDVSQIGQNEFMRIRKEEKKQERIKGIELDLHAEALGINPYQSSSSDILQSQLAEVHKGLSDALVRNYESMILIHGIGEGKLRKAVIQILSETSHVKNFAPADIHKYGNGATEVFFK